MTRRGGLSAIPTTYNNVNFRSRLESRWAALLDDLGIEWEYEAFDFRGAIPDMWLPDCRVLAEIKPTTDFAELAHRRDWLHATAREWILDGLIVLKHKMEMSDMIPLSAIDRTLEDISRVERGEDALYGRRAVALGARPFLDQSRDAATLDGQHYLVQCEHHVGIRRLDEPCLMCLETSTKFISGSEMMQAWRRAGSITQWKPASE